MRGNRCHHPRPRVHEHGPRHRRASGTDDLTVKNNWFGIKVDGTDEAIRQGVQVTADDALIGGTAGATGASAADRNIFANATVGAGVGPDVFIGDDAVIQGKWFGTNETGTAAAANDEDITLGGTNLMRPRTRRSAAPGEPGTCAGTCDVIYGATTDGIDLRGTVSEVAADTTITGIHRPGRRRHGGVPNAAAGIRVGNTPGTTVGASSSIRELHRRRLLRGQCADPRRPGAGDHRQTGSGRTPRHRPAVAAGERGILVSRTRPTRPRSPGTIATALERWTEARRIGRMC